MQHQVERTIGAQHVCLHARHDDKAFRFVAIRLEGARKDMLRGQGTERRVDLVDRFQSVRRNPCQVKQSSAIEPFVFCREDFENSGYSGASSRNNSAPFSIHP